MIRGVVQYAQCKIIDGKRCFVVSEETFLEIMSYFFMSAQQFQFDPRLASEGYDNVQIGLSALDKHTYYLATQSTSFLDKLWETKGPKET